MPLKARPRAAQSGRQTPRLGAASRLKYLDTASRLKYLRIVVACAYASGILLSTGLWFGFGRTIPRASLLGFLPASVSSHDYLFSILLLAALVLAVAARQPRCYLLAAIALMLLLVISDQTRLQPWVYQYLLMFALLACARTDVEADADAPHIIAASRLVVATLYFWGGAQKLNWTFGHEVLPALFEHAGVKLPVAFVSYLPAVGIAVALLEASLGVMLLLRRTRKIGVMLALGMHLLVLLLLIAAWQNSVVWVWNVSMACIVVLLFWQRDQTHEYDADARVLSRAPTRHLTKVVLVLCGLAPALSFVGLWDLYLSASLYSGNTPIAVLHIDERVRERLPAQAQQQLFKTGRGELMLPLHEWSLAELNVPPYPEARAYRQIARRVCKLVEDRGEIELIVKERPALIDRSYAVTRADCRNLILGQ